MRASRASSALSVCAVTWSRARARARNGGNTVARQRSGAPSQAARAAGVAGSVSATLSDTASVKPESAATLHQTGSGAGFASATSGAMPPPPRTTRPASVWYSWRVSDSAPDLPANA